MSPPPKATTRYRFSVYDKHKKDRKTCRHFKVGKCVFWWNPDACSFPHPPKDAPAHLTAQLPPSGRTPYDGRRAQLGDVSQYLGYHLNSSPPGLGIDFQPYHRLMPSLPAFPLEEPRSVHVQYYPGNEIDYHNPPSPAHCLHGGYNMPVSIQYASEYPQVHQHSYQYPYQLPYSPSGSAFYSPLTSSSLTSSTLPVNDGYVASSLVKQEEHPLADPQKLRRERSKACWHGKDCKKPNCYYRHDAAEKEAEGETFADADADSEKDKMKCNVKGLDGQENLADQRAPTRDEVSTEAKTAADDEITADDVPFKERPSVEDCNAGTRRRAPLLVNGTNYRRRAETVAA